MNNINITLIMDNEKVATCESILSTFKECHLQTLRLKNIGDETPVYEFGGSPNFTNSANTYIKFGECDEFINHLTSTSSTSSNPNITPNIIVKLNPDHYVRYFNGFHGSMTSRGPKIVPNYHPTWIKEYVDQPF